jgi:hypothetical protein
MTGLKSQMALKPWGAVEKQFATMHVDLAKLNLALKSAGTP